MNILKIAYWSRFNELIFSFPTKYGSGHYIDAEFYVYDTWAESSLEGITEKL